jgi:hypothetical protein
VVRGSAGGGGRGAPECDHRRKGRRVPGTNTFEAIRCERPAVLRVLVAHGPGTAKYESRCGLHNRGQLGPLVAAVWDPLGGEWAEQPPLRWYSQ